MLRPMDRSGSRDPNWPVPRAGAAF